MTNEAINQEDLFLLIDTLDAHEADVMGVSCQTFVHELKKTLKIYYGDKAYDA